MRYLFEPAQLDGKPMHWGHKSRTETDFPGYYHWHQCCEILFIHEGQGSVIVNRKTYEIRRGMLFFFQPFQLHKVFANVSPESPYVRTMINFDQVFLANGLRPFPVRHRFFTHLWQGKYEEQAFDLLAAAEHVEHIFEMFETIVSQGGNEEDEEITLLLLQILNSMAAAGEDKRRTITESVRIRPFRYSETIMQWIESHYTEDVSLDAMADALHLSKYYVSRIFRQETGSSITDYLTARRIKQACRLLQTTTLPVERIGIEVGFPNSSYFIRLFKKVVGTTPLKYRNHNEV